MSVALIALRVAVKRDCQEDPGDLPASSLNTVYQQNRVTGLEIYSLTGISGVVGIGQVLTGDRHVGLSRLHRAGGQRKSVEKSGHRLACGILEWPRGQSRWED